MQYCDEMYEELERREARWARQDAARGRQLAIKASNRGNHKTANKFNSWAYQKELDAEYHESRI